MRKLSILLLAALVTPALATLAEASSRIEKDLKLEPNGRFVLESEVGSVTLTGVSSSGARVVITSDRDDLEALCYINFKENPGSASVTLRRKDHLGGTEHISVHFEIQVPSQTETEIRTGGGSISLSDLQGDSELKTSHGPIEVSGLSGSLDAKTSHGPIHLQEVKGVAHLDTSGGKIEVASIDGSLTAHNSGGPIRVDRATGYVEAKTSGGPISVNFDRENSRGGVLETSGASIEVEVDRSANLEIDASTSGLGSVTTDLPIQVVGKISSSSLHGSLGSGGEMLRLHTSDGSIHIKAL